MGIRHGEDELCFINPALAGKAPSADGSDWSELCGDWDFPLWGGGKTWIAPESKWPNGAPHRDLDSGNYTLRSLWINTHSMGVELECPVCPLTQLQIQRRIELLKGSATWRVTQTISNRGTETRQCGVWDVLMLRRPGNVMIPLPATERDAVKAVHPFVGIGPIPDLFEAGIIDIDQGSLKVRCDEAVAFKVGALSSHGEMHVHLNASGTAPLLYRRRSDISGADSYAHGHPIEVFNAPVLPYFEVESHSRLATLSPGESVALLVEESLISNELNA